MSDELKIPDATACIKCNSVVLHTEHPVRFAIAGCCDSCGLGASAGLSGVTV